ncbi:hypothetical protein AN644_03010 [Candidatus Epulonipiscium fishelsonii]|nr:hypothetical protein AN644_03010 [Epulopiscium sp. SCG-C06WGA-EpuloA1]
MVLFVFNIIFNPFPISAIKEIYTEEKDRKERLKKVKQNVLHDIDLQISKATMNVEMQNKYYEGMPNRVIKNLLLKISMAKHDSMNYIDNVIGDTVWLFGKKQIKGMNHPIVYVAPSFTDNIDNARSLDTTMGVGVCIHFKNKEFENNPEKYSKELLALVNICNNKVSGIKELDNMVNIFKEEYDINGFLNEALKMYNNDLGWELEEVRKEAREEALEEGEKKGEKKGLLLMVANTYKLTNDLNLAYASAATYNISEEVVNNYLKEQGLL